MWWWDPSYIGPEKLKELDKDWQALHKDEKWILRKLVKSPFRQLLVESFRRYTSALDESNPQNSFLQLWSLLESLTGTQRADFAQTVRRASFLYDEHQFHCQILNHLRERRNMTIHKGQSYEDDETILCQIKRYCEQMMRFLIRTKQLKTFQQYCDFLDTPKDVGTLKDNIALYKQSMKFRMSKPHQKTCKNDSING